MFVQGLFLGFVGSPRDFFGVWFSLIGLSSIISDHPRHLKSGGNPPPPLDFLGESPQIYQYYTFRYFFTVLHGCHATLKVCSQAVTVFAHTRWGQTNRLGEYWWRNGMAVNVVSIFTWEMFLQKLKQEQGWWGKLFVRFLHYQFKGGLPHLGSFQRFLL